LTFPVRYSGERIDLPAWQGMPTMRAYIRHTTQIPIEFSRVEAAPVMRCEAKDIAMGGLSFHSDDRIETGTTLKIRITLVQPAFEALGQVAWCRRRPARGFHLGVRFLDPQAAGRLRMVEQICHIEDYRKLVEEIEGRTLSSNDAALEWIERHAASFPGSVLPPP
jgi:hypothetical protein